MTLHEAHGDPRNAVEPDFVDGADARMIESRRNLRLALEAVHHRLGQRAEPLQDLLPDEAADQLITKTGYSGYLKYHIN